MCPVTLEKLTKVYPNGYEAVHEFDLEVADGEFMVLVGPSGCGKTTAMRMVAGLEQISSGTLRIGDRIMNDVSPRDRDIAMVFQNYALYPHMTVGENIGFALKMKHTPKQEIVNKVRDTAEILGLTEWIDRKPGQLSGGQRQRVAMGRAIVREPKVFLMDEPLSNLDAKLRVQMRAEVARIQRRLGVATIYVTHDQVEAMTMGDRVAVMRDGKLQQVDTPQDLYDRPANEFVAGFMGSPPMNLIRCRVRSGEDRVEVVFGDQVVELPWHYTSSHTLPPSGVDVVVGVRPEDVLVADASSTNTIKARVERREALGSEILVHLSHLDVTVGTEVATRDDARVSTLVAKMGPRSSVSVGDVLSVQISPEHAHFFDAVTGATLREN